VRELLAIAREALDIGRDGVVELRRLVNGLYRLEERLAEAAQAGPSSERDGQMDERREGCPTPQEAPGPGRDRGSRTAGGKSSGATDDEIDSIVLSARNASSARRTSSAPTPKRLRSAS
jgi:hypothetical protein